MKCTTIVLLTVAMLLPSHLNAQLFHNMEVSGGWAHISGNNGLDGWNAGASLWFTKRISIAFDADDAGDTSQLSAFVLTNLGVVTTKSRMQDYLIGPRIFFDSKQIQAFHTIHPFAEFQAGASHLSSTFSEVGVGSVSTSDDAGTWLLGGGTDVLISPHWAGRINLGLLRTHLTESAQSRLRMSLELVYTFRSRKVQ